MKKSFILLGILILLLLVAIMPPGNFGNDVTFSIREGSGLSGVARQLKEAGLIRSEFLYKSFSVLMGGTGSIKAGDYFFEQPQTLLRVAWRTSQGDHGLEKIKVTIPEGSSSQEIAWLILKSIPDFNAPAFQAIAKEHEGYLFPDTYFFYPNVSPEEALITLRKTFDEKTKSLDARIQAFGKSKSDIIKMASIVEKEAATKEDRRIVAGILWKRLNNDMALQVDFPFYYLYGKESKDISLADLREDDSPYNLYMYRGLPPTAVSNPGLAAIEDTITPNEMPYWYYLSDKDGKMHYAVTLNGHVANKEMYLW